MWMIGSIQAEHMIYVVSDNGSLAVTIAPSTARKSVANLIPVPLATGPKCCCSKVHQVQTQLLWDEGVKECLSCWSG
jgi:hypothetical protein